MSTWTRVASLVVPSGRLSLSDSSFFLESPLVVEIRPGTYTVEVQSGSHDGVRIVERLRMTSADVGSISRGRLCGYVDLQFSQLGLCDRDAFEQALAGTDAQEWLAFTEQFAITSLTGVARLPSGEEMILVKPGFGDLDPAVYELVDGGECRGIEAAFLAPEARD